MGISVHEKLKQTHNTPYPRNTKCILFNLKWLSIYYTIIKNDTMECGGTFSKMTSYLITDVYLLDYVLNVITVILNVF